MVESLYTIVVPDSEVLSGICGTNDSNLKLIEDFLGVPVFTKGNELSLSDADKSVCQLFNDVIDKISKKVEKGEEPCADMISSVLHDCEYSFEKNFFSANSIKIPGGFNSIYPRSANQAELISSMRESDLVFCLGPAGSGKTFLVVAESLALLLSRKKRKLILTRPVVEAGENLGFLPGDLEQKINPYLRPLYDAMELLLPREILRRMEENGLIEIAPLAYMRGRTLSDCVVLLDEAQNTTVGQMKMFLTRMGEGTKMFITGDESQVDLPRRVESGLIHATNILKEIPDIKMVRMTAGDIVRNSLVKKIVEAYDNAKETS